jgi:hypothetical protein
MSANENPYASPQVATSVTPRQIVLKQLRPPAIGLLLTSGLMLILYGMSALAILIPYVRGNPELLEANLELFRPFWFAHLAMILGSLITLYTGAQLFLARQYFACLIGAFLAAIPIITPCYVLGIPFAIWALVILLRKDTRAAFAEAA